MSLIELSDSARLVCQLLTAAFLGGLIGLEREMHGESAGFRTNIMICMSACLMMQVSLNMETLFRHLDTNAAVRLDPGRIASYAVAGMGFLGGGAIIKGSGSVRGLTTAAGLWMLTGVGLAVGAGFYLPAVLTVLIAAMVLYGLRRFKGRLQREKRASITVVATPGICDWPSVEAVFKRDGSITVERRSYRNNLAQNIAVYDFRIVSIGERQWQDIYDQLAALKGVIEVSWTYGIVV